MSITILPTSTESVGNAVRRFAQLGYSLTHRNGRIVAEPFVKPVVPVRKSVVERVFDFARILEE